MTRQDDKELEAIEIELLIEGLYRRYGVDLRHYERGPLWRRICERRRMEQAPTVSALQEKALRDAGCLDRLLLALAVNGGAVFGAPEFFSAFRVKVVPMLRTYPFIRIWHAGCSTGEEVYSMAIILNEEGLYERSRIYATEISGEAVKRAKEGVYPLSEAPRYANNYLRSGGSGRFSDYYTARDGRIFFDPELKRNVTFLEHNLATDGSFNEFHVILCRDAMHYFDPDLQGRVHELIYESLIMFGALGIDGRGSLRRSPREAFYEALDEENHIYRKTL